MTFNESRRRAVSSLPPPHVLLRPVLVLLAGVCLLAVIGCQGTQSSPSAATIVDSAVARHGGNALQQAVVSLTFRDDRYRLEHDGAAFHYRRTYIDSTGHQVVEGITNDSTYRRIDGMHVSLTDSQKASVHTTVNSVAYFALLPEPLTDAAVQPTYLGRDTIGGVPYHRIRVTFQQNGGGEDWQDVFVYWFRADTYAMEYLAYAYGLEPDEEFGTRFREAYNIRNINGVRFADYLNYTVDTLSADQLARYPKLLQRDAVRLVSHVELDSVRVRRF